MSKFDDDRRPDKMAEHHGPFVASRAMQFALTPLGFLILYGSSIIALVAVLGINVERNRFENGLYWLLPAFVVIGIGLPYTITALAHLIIARSLGFKVDYFGVGPVQIVTDNTLKLSIRNSWNHFSSYRITSRGLGNGWKQNVSMYLFAGWVSTAIPLWIVTPYWNRLMSQVDSGEFIIEFATPLEILYAFTMFFLTFGSWGWAFLFTVGGLIIPLRDLFLDRDRVNHHLTHLDIPEPRRATQSRANSTEVIQTVRALNSQAPEQGEIRPRDWDADGILTLASDWTIQPPDILNLLRAYYHTLDCGDPALAGSYLVRAVTAARETNALSHPRLYPEAAYFFARFRRDLPSAKMYLKRAEHQSAAQHVTQRAQAAIQLAEGNKAAANEIALAALSDLVHRSPPGMAIAERIWLEQILQEASGHAVAQDVA